MERTKSKQKWRKIGGGVFRIGSRTVRPGEVFYADASEIPSSFRDIVIPVPTQGFAAPEVLVPSVPTYMIISAGAGWYDIVNALTEKPINEKRLRLAVAEKMLADLQKV